MATTPAKQNLNLNIKVETVNPITRKLTIKVPAAVVTQRIQTGLLEVQKTAKVKGFRPGFVPLPMVKQFYGADVNHHVFHRLIDDSYQAAINQEKLKAVGSPQIETPDHMTGKGEHDHTLSEGKDLTFTATVEIMPDVEVKGYTGLALTRASDTVDAKDFDKAIEQLRNSYANLKAVEDAAYKAKKGDYVDMTFDGGVMTDKGLEKRDGMKGARMLEIGSDQFIEGFEENLVGMKKGETKTFKITFPKDYFEASLAGQKAEFTVSVNEIKLKELPELNDEFAKDMGYENVADLNKNVKEQLTLDKKNEADRKIRSDLLQTLIDKTKFDVPASLIQAQTRALAQDVAQNLKQQGFNDQMIQEALMTEMDNLKKRAENQVKASLILESISKQEKIEVVAADIDAEIAKMAVNMKMEAAKIREFYHANPQRRDDLDYRLREEKTMLFLIDKAKVKNEK